jgi:hypothetical protein
MTVELKPLPNDLIDQLLADYKKPEDLIGQNGLLKQANQGDCRASFAGRDGPSSGL